MATAWILGKISGALQPTVQGAVGSAGTFAGGAMNTIGSSINGVGESINGSIKGYGDGAKDYGNSIMDWTKASGPRAQTAKNPLGLSDTAAGGKRSVTSPNIYRAPPRAKPAASKSLATTSRTAPTPQKKANNNVPKKTQASLAAKNATSRTGVAPKKQPSAPGSVGVKKTISAESRPVKPRTTAGAKTITPKNTKAAANPLGLKEK